MSISESLFSVDEEEVSISGESFESGSYRSVQSSHTTSTNISRLTTKQQQALDDESLATQESKDLIRFRLFLVTILFWTTIGVGLAVWIYFTESIESGFEMHFEDEAQELYEETASKIMVAYGAIDSFALALSAQFFDWPFVTVPNFSLQAQRLQNLSNAVIVTNYHLVEREEIEDWTVYTTNNDFWVEGNNNTAIPRNTLLGKPNAIEMSSNSSFLPQWQQSPVNQASPYGTDGFEYNALASAWDVFQKESRVVMGYINNLPTDRDPDLDVEEQNTLMTNYVGNTTHHTEPFADFFYPITHAGAEGNQVVGVVSATFYWRDILKKTHSNRVDGIHVVIENTCNQTFTYTWVDSELVYLGEGDHSEGGEGMSFPLPESGMYGSSHSDDCQYTIHTYPSAAMLDFFKRTEPNPVYGGS